MKEKEQFMMDEKKHLMKELELQKLDMKQFKELQIEMLQTN